MINLLCSDCRLIYLSENLHVTVAVMNIYNENDYYYSRQFINIKLFITWQLPADIITTCCGIGIKLHCPFPGKQQKTTTTKHWLSEKSVEIITQFVAMKAKWNMIITRMARRSRRDLRVYPWRGPRCEALIGHWWPLLSLCKSLLLSHLEPQLWRKSLTKLRINLQNIIKLNQ